MSNDREIGTSNSYPTKKRFLVRWVTTVASFVAGFALFVTNINQIVSTTCSYIGCNPKTILMQPKPAQQNSENENVRITIAYNFYPFKDHGPGEFLIFEPEVGTNVNITINNDSKYVNLYKPEPLEFDVKPGIHTIKLNFMYIVAATNYATSGSCSFSEDIKENTLFVQYFELPNGLAKPGSIDQFLCRLLRQKTRL